MYASPRRLFTLIVLSTVLVSGCVSSTAPRPPDRDLARRIESAFELEKQRRAGMPRPHYAPHNPGLDSIQGLRASLASERQRRSQLETELSRLRVDGAERGRSGAELARLRAELAGERDRNRAMKKELERANKTSIEGPSLAKLNALQAQLARERQRRQALENELALLSSGQPGSGAAAPEVARLRQQLEQEKRRRLEVEKAWTRLREETSLPALSGSVSEAEFLAVKTELLETRRALEIERAAHERTAAATTAPAAEPQPSHLNRENQRLRARVSALQRERDVLKRAISEIGDESESQTTAAEAELEVERLPVP